MGAGLALFRRRQQVWELKTLLIDRPTIIIDDVEEITWRGFPISMQEENAEEDGFDRCQKGWARNLLILCLYGELLPERTITRLTYRSCARQTCIGSD